jgi:CRP-like cAMP-binding protein
LSRLFALDPSARRVKAGDVLFHEGDVGDELFVVIEGEFDIVSRGRSIVTIAEGAVAGELAMLGSSARRATAVAKSDGTVAPVDAARFAYLVRYAPTFALTVLRSLSNLLDAVVASTASEAAEHDVPPGTTRANEANLDVGADAPSRPFAAGEVIFQAGDPGDTMFFVLAGEVTIGTSAGDRTTAQVGDVFGEMALVDHQPRTSSAVAATDARVVPIDELRFTEIVQNNPNFAIAVMRSVAKRILAKADQRAGSEPVPTGTPATAS